MHCVYQPGILEEGTSPFFTLSCAFCGALLVLTIGAIERYTNYNGCSCIQLHLLV